jgi:hypothetical protein
LLAGGLPLLARFRGLDVTSLGGARGFRLACLGWLLGLALIEAIGTDRALRNASGALVGSVLVLVVDLLRSRATSSGPGQEAVSASRCIALGSVAFAAGALGVWLGSLARPEAPTNPAPPATDPAPSLVPSTAPAPQPRDVPTDLEPEDDQLVKADTQAWCEANKSTKMRNFTRPQTRRFADVRSRYLGGEKAAACELERLVRAAVPERGPCTALDVDEVVVECAERTK